MKPSDVRTFITEVTAGAGSSYHNFVLGLVKNCFQLALEDRAILEIPDVREEKDSVWKRKRLTRPLRIVPMRA